MRSKTPSAAPAKQPLSAPEFDRWKLYAALAAIALVAYANSFGLGLAFDGRRVVTSDARIRVAAVENLKQIFTTHYWWPSNTDRLYRPITTASYWLNYAVLGSADHAAGYHWLNFLLHALNVILVFELARRLLVRAEPAFLAAAIWAVHPIGTEAVTNIAGRSDLLATAAVLGGLLLYARIAEHGARPTTVAALFAVATLGYFSKESAAVLIALMVLWDLFRTGDPLRTGNPLPTGDPLRTGNPFRTGDPLPTGDPLRTRDPLGRPLAFLKRSWPAYAAAIVPLILLVVARANAFTATPWPDLALVDNPLKGAGFLAARLTAIKVIGLQLAMLVWPWRLSFDYSYNQIPVIGAADPLAWLSLLIVGALLAIAIARFRRDPVIFWAAGFFGITLLPTSNLLLLIGSIMAVRFLYLPSVAFAIAATALIYRLPNPRIARGILAAAVVLFAARTLARNPAWDNDLTLGAADVNSAPASFKTHKLLGTYLFRESPNNLDRATKEDEAAWAILTTAPLAAMDLQIPGDLGMFYQMQGDRAGGANTPQGREWYEKSAAVLQRGAGAAEAVIQAFDEAQAAHGRPLIARGGPEILETDLGLTLVRQGRFDEALSAFLAAQRANPYYQDLYDQLALEYVRRNQLPDAAVALDQKVSLFGMSPQTLASLRSVYGHLPEGACALRQDGNTINVNLDCPLVKTDMCKAWGDLIPLLDEARLTDAAAAFKQRVALHGCP